jgi:mono/diheme cytochrome c family protein
MREWMNNVRGTRKLLGLASVSALVLFMVLMAWAQESKPVKTPPATPGAGANVERGKYIVNQVAMCVNCHTPRDEKGELDRSQLLMGAPVFYQAAQPMGDWPQRCPRIGGTPPGTDEEMITLLTTGIWNTGKPLREPMPRFRMTREDAAAVVAYLKSLK